MSYHNLDLSKYSFEEILALFDVPYQLTKEELFKAKLHVMRMHPDKSKLPNEYFIFFQNAYNILHKHYNMLTKESNPVVSIEYDSKQFDTSENSTEHAIKNQLQGMKKQTFQTKFNDVFDSIMVDKEFQQKQKERTEWFSQPDQDPDYGIPAPKNASELADAIQKVKNQQQVSVHKGIRECHISRGAYSNFYDDDVAESNDYISSNVFTKLPFDDIRKVHKDQTVFTVSENDYIEPRYKTVEQYNQFRADETMRPLEPNECKNINLKEDPFLLNQTELLRAAQRQILADQRSELYANKNKSVLSQFLRLT